MTVAMIVAAGEDNAIGKGHDMLWHLPDDFKFFKKTTEGHPVVMGRKTIESLGKPLKNRSNIVVTHNQDFEQEGTVVKHSLDEALSHAKSLHDEEIFIIGGGQIYKLGLLLANKVYLTRVHAEFPEADVFFPELPANEWQLVEEENHPADERHAYAFTFQVFVRK